MNKENREQNRLPLVSIIVPAYNVAPYIEECVQSLLEQSYKNIEIIIVNDGSTDKTGELSDVYSHTYSNVKVLHKKKRRTFLGAKCRYSKGKRGVYRFCGFR